MASISLENFVRFARLHEANESQRIILSHQQTSASALKAKEASALKAKDAEGSNWLCGGRQTNVQEENRAVWNAFLQAIEKVNGCFPNRIKILSQRFGFDFYAARNAGEPFCVKHIVMYGIAAALPRVCDIEKVAARSIKTLTTEEICGYAHSLNPYNFLGKHRPPSQLYGGSESWLNYSRLTTGKYWAALATTCASEEESEEAIRQRRQPGVEDPTETWWGRSYVNQQKSWIQFFDRFSKAMISYEPPPGTLIPVPVEEGRIEMYYAKQMIAKEGLVAYVFVPTNDSGNLPAYLSFRQTQPQLRAVEGVKSLLNDVEPHMGETGYLAAKQQLTELFQDETLKKHKFICGGYSLGAAFLQRFIAELSSPMMSRIKECHFWNGPGIEQSICDRFADKVNRFSDYDLDEIIFFYIYRNTGDPTSHLGETHLGWNVDNPFLKFKLIEHQYEGVEQEDPIPGMTHHKLRHYDKNLVLELGAHVKTVEYDKRWELLVELDNRKRLELSKSNPSGAFFDWEDFRMSCIVQTCRCLLIAIYSFLELIFFLFGWKVFRTAEDLS